MELESEPVKLNKTAFIPFRMSAGRYEYYLQKRDRNAPTHPSMLDMFGGASELGESAEQCVVREVQEELRYVPRHIQHLGSIESIRSHCDVFIEEVTDDFESRVVVCEGECGVFVTLGKAMETPSNPLALVALESLERFLTSSQNIDSREQ